MIDAFYASFRKIFNCLTLWLKSRSLTPILRRFHI